ncbi:MAG: right-handed parallel beta-helix repeat-containing protein [Bacteroidales bacterium]|nr:right-handed parallel beta-helix repeat-containing protein [Bacteroidales bacterium]
MKKLITLLMAVALTSTGLWSQTIGPNLNEGFEGGVIPDNWTVLNVDGGTQVWNAQTVNPNTGTYSARVRYESSTLDNNDWLITPPLWVTSSTTDEISFWMRTYSASYTDPWEVLISTTDTSPASFTMIDNGTGNLASYVQKTYSLDSYGDAIVYLAVRYIGSNDWYLYVDDFVGPPVVLPSCPPPTGLAVNNITTTSADLSWTPGFDEDLWNVKYGAPGFDPDIAGTLVSGINVIPHTLSGLTLLTNYEVYVQADCGTKEVSDWVGPVSFQTLGNPLSGNYTINSTLATGGTNFESFNDFAAAINLGGFAGPVVVDVVATTGPYNEQVMFSDLPNSSGTNTLTINGNNEILEYLSANTNERATLKFDGTDYVTVNNLIVKALGSVTGEYGWAVWLANGADYNSFYNSQFVASTSATLTNFAGFVTSNSATGATTAGLAASNLTVEDCTAIGGYYGMIINGPSTAPFSDNNSIINNEIKDFNLYGLYLRGQNNSMISDNIITRPTRTTTGTLYMLYVTQDMTGTTIMNNQMYDFSPSVASTSTAHGIYGTTISATPGQELLIANNVIFGFQNMNGIQYGMYMTTTDNTRFYHNSMSLDNVGHSGSSVIRGLYHSGNLATIDFRNNIISITSNSTGIKYCMYFVQTLANIPNLTSDHNVLHMGATVGTNHLVFWNGGGGPSFTTLTDWQAAGGGIYDQNSVDADPTFFTPLLTPLNPAMNNIGVNLLTFVPEDIFGVARTATPDPGAIEFDPPSCFPPTVPVVSNVTHNSVTLSWNPGSDETLWNLKYGAPGFDPDIEGTLITGITTTTYLLEGLAENTSYDVYVQADCNVRSLSSWAGPAQFTTMYANDLAVIGIISPTSNTCYDGSEVVSILITNLGGASVDVSFDASYQIDVGTPVTETVNLTITPGDTVTYTFTTPIDFVITEEFTFDLTVSVDLASDLNSNNDEMGMPVTFFIIPDPPTGIDGNTTAGNTAMLEATSTLDVKWYASTDPGDLDVLYTGAVFTTPVLYTSTPFYAAASSGSQENAGKPAPTSTTNTSGNNWGLVFDVVNADATIRTVDVYSVGTGGQMSVELRDNAGALIETLGPFTYPSGTTGDPTIVTFDLNLSVPIGTGYRLLGVSMSGNLIRESSGNTYPYNSPSGNVVVTSGYISGTSTTYYWFYNWVIGDFGCESERTEVWANMPEGAVGGNVSQASRSVIEGARVFSNVGNFEAFTDAFGNYLIEDVGAGTYDFYCEADGYFTQLVEDVVILENQTTTLNFELGFAEISVDPASIAEELQEGQTSTKQLTISNPGGTETLTWSAAVGLPVGGGKAALFAYPENQGENTLSGDVDANPDSQQYFQELSRNAFDLYGYFPTGAPGSEYSVVTDGQYIYTAAWDANAFNKYDMNGTFIEQFSITGAGNVRDLTYDGQYFYGSANNNIIFEMNFSTQTLVSSITAPVGNQIRGIAYDPVNDGFWVTGTSFSGPFRLISRAGALVQEITTTVGGISGLAYDGVSPGGPYLWAYTPASSVTGEQILVQINMTTGAAIQSVDLTNIGIFQAGAVSGGLNITNQVVPGVWTFLGLAQNNVVWLMELSGWLTLDPTSGTVAPGGNNVVDVNFNTAGLSVGTYELSIVITHDALEVNRGVLSIPVTLDVVAASCPAPNNLYAANISFTEADLGWTPGGTEGLWNVEVGVPGFTPGQGQNVDGVIGTGDNPWLVKELNHSTDYEFYVQADCDELGETSIWAGPYSFSTLELCPAPTALTATNITATSADLGWTVVGTETMWNVEVGASGFTPGTGNSILSVTATMVNPWTASPLDAITTYDFYVQADCGSGEESSWAGPFEFSTLCGVSDLPFSEDFTGLLATQIPECWSKADLGLTNWGAVLTGNAGGTSPEMRFYFSPSFTGVSRLITPPISTGGKLDLMVRMDQFLDDYTTNDGEYIALEYSVDGGTNWTEFWQYLCTADYGAVYDLIPFTLPPATDEFLIAFKFSGYSFNIDNWYFDNVLIDELKYPVTFNVDVTTISGFNYDTEVIYIAGDFPGAIWNEPGTNPNLLMSRVGLTNVYTITLDLPPASYEYKYFRNAGWDGGEWAGGANRNIAVAGIVETEDVFGGDITFANLQWPPDGTITEGGSFIAYGQAFIPNGITGAAGATFGLEAWVGVSTTDTDPAGWSTWVPATFNSQSGDNDEFQADIASGLTPGTYYYAYRYRFGQVYGEYLYGGYNGGFWNGITNVSGVLTVNSAGPPSYRLVSGAVDDCLDATDEVEIDGATVENGAIADIRSGGIITATDFEVKDGGTAYMTAVTSITLGDEVLITPGATGLFLAKIDTFDPCVLPPALVASVEEVIPDIPAVASFFKVFPNPTTGSFKLELTGVEESSSISVEIFGMMGERVFQDQLFGSMLYEFDLSSMPKGIYFIRVLQGDEMGIEKVIKQ